MTDRYETIRDAAAGILFAIAAVVIVGLVIAVVFSCTAPTVRPPLAAREGVRAESSTCYGAGTVWCSCPASCGGGWRLDAAHRIWRHTTTECNCDGA